MIQLTPARRARLTAFLRDSLEQAHRNRQDRVVIWQEALDRYEAKTIQKNVPFFGASSLHVPIVAIAHDSISAKIINAIRSQDKLLSARPMSEEPLLDPQTGQPIVDPVSGQAVTWRLVAELLEEYLLYELSPAGDVCLEDAIREFVSELLHFGTAHLKTTWETEVARDFFEDGTFIDHTVRDNVRFTVPSIEDVYVPHGYCSLDRLPWFVETYLLRESEIRQRETTHGWDKEAISNFFKDVHGEAQLSELTQRQDDLEKVSPPNIFIKGEYRIAEAWLRFDLDGNGREVRILVDFPLDHPECIFRIMPWPYQHGRLPYALARYIRRRKRYYGMGVAERLASLDEGISTAVNQMIDNVSIANTRIWSVDENSKAARELDRIWAGKKIPRSNKDDIVPLQMGEVYPSIFESINILNQFQEKVSKLSDYNLGRESQALGKQSTATATLALLQETNQYHDATVADVRSATNAAIWQWVFLLGQFQPFDRVRQVLGQRGDILLAALTLPPADLQKRLSVQVALSSTASTQELARQEEMSKIQIMQQYYQALLGLATGFFAQPLAPMAALYLDIAKDADTRIRRLLETFGDSYTTTTLPSLEKVLNNVPLAPGPGVMAAQFGLPQAGTPGPDGASGMAAPSGGASVAANTATGTPPEVSPPTDGGNTGNRRSAY